MLCGLVEKPLVKKLHLRLGLSVTNRHIRNQLIKFVVMSEIKEIPVYKINSCFDDKYIFKKTNFSKNPII